MAPDKTDIQKLFQFPLCLAPMVGLSHVVLRQIIFEYLPTDQKMFFPTEMLNSRKIPHEKLGATAETLLHPYEGHLVPQILGNDKNHIQTTIQKMMRDWSNSYGHSPLVGIDINMGCPVQKALKHNYGVALMGDLNYAAKVVEYAAESSALPVSVKLRAVQSEQSVKDLIHFVKTLQSAGAQWVTLHPRTAEQKRRGQADWTQIKDLKAALDFPIIGNGDIQTADDVFRMKEQTGCDLVMAGRALAARPWMVWQIAEKLKLPLKETYFIHSQSKVPLTEQEEGAEYGRMLLRFIELTEFYFCQTLAYQPEYAFRKINFFVKMTHVWLQFGHTLASEVSKSKSFEEMKIRVQQFFSQEQIMYPETDLRQ